MITLTGILSFVVTVIIIASFFGALFWLVRFLALPDPWGKFAIGALAVVSVVVICLWLISLLGGDPMLVPIRFGGR